MRKFMKSLYETDEQSLFNDILEIEDGLVSIHMRNIQILATGTNLSITYHHLL